MIWCLNVWKWRPLSQWNRQIQDLRSMLLQKKSKWLPKRTKKWTIFALCVNFNHKSQMHYARIVIRVSNHMERMLSESIEWSNSGVKVKVTQNKIKLAVKKGKKSTIFALCHNFGHNSQMHWLQSWSGCLIIWWWCLLSHWNSQMQDLRSRSRKKNQNGC